MKKRWLFVTLLVGALAIGITGSGVLAQGGATGGSSPFKSMTSRVAAILGLDETKVQGAFNQAAKEMRDEALQQMVTQGRLTQEQADQIKQRNGSAPEARSPRFPFGGHGMNGNLMPPGGRGGHEKGFKQGGPKTPSPAPQGSGASTS